MRKRTRKLALAVIVLLVLLGIGYNYTVKNPGAIGNIIGEKPEPAATTPAITVTIPSITGITEATSTVTVTSSDGTIKVGAFNLQVFGTAKASKPEVMGVLSKIIRNYDVIAVQEIRDSSQTALPKLRDAVNLLGNPQYDYVVSERLGKTTSKEQYAYLYNIQTINGESLHVSGLE